MNQPDDITITATAEEWRDFETYAKVGALAMQTIEIVRHTLRAHQVNLANFHSMSNKIHEQLIKTELRRTAQERKTAA